MVDIHADSIILVAYLPSPKDLEIARMLGWYRIPLRTSPKMIDVDFLAFFQGANFGEEHRWKIEYFASCLGHELSTRAELLRDEPNHPRAREEYYKIQLGSLLKLTRPILADRWKRLTFLYTTGELINTASTLNDLVLMEPDREVMWKSLRERSHSAQSYRSTQNQDEESMLELLQWLTSLNGDWRDLDFSDY